MDQCPNCGYREQETPAYVRKLNSAIGSHIFIGGRQTLKTQTLIERAANAFENGDDVVYVAPVNRMAQEARERFISFVGEEKLLVNQQGVVGGFESSVGFMSASQDFYLGPDKYDVVLIDEAANCKQSVLTGLNPTEYGTVIVAGTPTPETGVFNGYAQYNPLYETWYVPSTAHESPLSQQWCDEQYTSMSATAYESDIMAKYWDGDTWDIEPDHDYS